MTTYTCTIPDAYAPDTRYLADAMLERPEVLDVIIHSRFALTVITTTDEIHFAGYQDYDGWRWYCNVE